MRITQVIVLMAVISILLPVAAGAQSMVALTATVLGTGRTYADEPDPLSISVRAVGPGFTRLDAPDGFGYFTDIALLLPYRTKAVQGTQEEELGPQIEVYTRAVLDVLVGPALGLPIGPLSLFGGAGLHANTIVLMAPDSDPGDYLSFSVGLGAFAGAVYPIGRSFVVTGMVRLSYDFFELIRIPKVIGDPAFTRGFTVSASVGIGVLR